MALNSNEIGKYILMVSAPVFVATLFLMFSESIPEPIGVILILSSYILLCMSFSLIYYHSTTVKRKKAIKIIVIISSSIFVLGWLFKFQHWAGATILIIV